MTHLTKLLTTTYSRIKILIFYLIFAFFMRFLLFSYSWHACRHMSSAWLQILGQQSAWLSQIWKSWWHLCRDSGAKYNLGCILFYIETNSFVASTCCQCHNAIYKRRQHIRAKIQFSWTSATKPGGSVHS